jgi:DNA-binding CsgD family transcriptional regulator
MLKPDHQDDVTIKRVSSLAHYWESIRPRNDVGITIEDAWRKKVEFMDEVSVQNNAVVFLWNAYTNRFLYMSDKLKVLNGLEPAEFTTLTGVEYALTQVHPDHLQPLLHLWKKLTINYCAENNIDDYKSFKICLNYLFKNAAGEFMQILHRPVILEVDENNKPSLILNFTYHVDYIKRKDSMGGVVIHEDSINICDYNHDQKDFEPTKTFSTQELKILELLGKGYHSKAIADQLFISSHTVDTHRRNLIKKTNCLDTTGVVAFARIVGLI